MEELKEKIINVSEILQMSFNSMDALKEMIQDAFKTFENINKK